MQKLGKKNIAIASEFKYVISITGDKSEVLDIDNPDLNKFPRFTQATRYEGILQAGDILFIPGKLNTNLLKNHARKKGNKFKIVS